MYVARGNTVLSVLYPVRTQDFNRLPVVTCMILHGSINGALVTIPSVQGGIQFFIDAIDRAAGPTETMDIINRFPIDLELELGRSLTIRHTGIFNIPRQVFDMSFQVQCSNNYYGSNCSIFCIPTPLEEVDCNSQEGVVCTQNNHDPSANCSSCLQGFLGENCDISGKHGTGIMMTKSISP